MDNKKKKNILNILVLASIALFIVSNITPSFTMSSKDMLEDLGYNNIDIYVNAEFYYFFSRYTIVDNRNVFSDDENVVKVSILVMNSYRLVLYEEKMTPSMKDPYNDFKGTTAWWIENKDVYDVGLAFFSIFLVFLYFFLCYKNLKNIGKKRNKYSLYAGFIGIFIAAGFYFIINRTLGFFYELYPKYMVFGYGFYYFLISSLLFLFVYFLQNFVDFSDENSDEKIKKDVKSKN